MTSISDENVWNQSWHIGEGANLLKLETVFSNDTKNNIAAHEVTNV